MGNNSIRLSNGEYNPSRMVMDIKRFMVVALPVVFPTPLVNAAAMPSNLGWAKCPNSAHAYTAVYGVGNLGSEVAAGGCLKARHLLAFRKILAFISSRLVFF